MESYATWLEELLPKAHGEWAIGYDRYTRLLRVGYRSTGSIAGRPWEPKAT